MPTRSRVDAVVLQAAGTASTTRTTPSTCCSNRQAGAVVVLDAITRLAARGWISHSFFAISPQGDPLHLLVSCFAPRLQGTKELATLKPSCSAGRTSTEAGPAAANSNETVDVDSMLAALSARLVNGLVACSAAAVLGTVESAGCGASLLPKFRVLPSWGACVVKRAISDRLGWPADSFRVFVGHGGPELHHVLEPVPTCSAARTQVSSQSGAIPRIRAGTLQQGFTLTVLRRSALPADWAATLAKSVLLDPWGSLDRLSSIVCSRSGTRLAALCDEHPQVGVFSLLGPRKRWLPIRDGDAKQAVHVALSSDGALVAIGFKDGSASMFDVSSETGNLQERSLCGPETSDHTNVGRCLLRGSITGAALPMAFSVTGRWIAIAGTKFVRIFDAKSGSGLVSSFAVSAASRLVFVQCRAPEADDNNSERLAIFQPNPREIVFAEVPTGRISGRCAMPRVLDVSREGPAAFSDCGKYVTFVHQQEIFDCRESKMIFSLRVQDLRSRKGDCVWESPLTSERCVHDVAICGGNFPRVAMLWSKPFPALQLWDFLKNNMCLSIPLTMLPRREEFQYLKSVNVAFLDQGRFVVVTVNASMASTSVRLWCVPQR
eukprot:INCI18819.1.p1 GENE.INCI18819.1~~INCI18819.1.p1  ORF type:complete len:623 (+),score=60.88 INCI18819.1:57-1871(+)